jgi:hypothetical protein
MSVVESGVERLRIGGVLFARVQPLPAGGFGHPLPPRRRAPPSYRDDSVLVKQSECVIEPLRTPPLPAESFAPSGAHQMPPNLLLHPELNVGKTPATWLAKIDDQVL